MSEFRLTQISDTHLARRLTALTANFAHVSEYIDATRPDLVVNSGDLAFDAPTQPDDLEFARVLHDALPVAATTRPRSAPLPRSPSPRTNGRRSLRRSATTAGASRPPAGASSASIRW
jgi:3',5'-cyclic AMP phosphodiesterase CpdA